MEGGSGWKEGTVPPGKRPSLESILTLTSAGEEEEEEEEDRCQGCQGHPCQGLVGRGMVGAAQWRSPRCRGCAGGLVINKRGLGWAWVLGAIVTDQTPHLKVTLRTRDGQRWPTRSARAASQHSWGGSWPSSPSSAVSPRSLCDGQEVPARDLQPFGALQWSP